MEQLLKFTPSSLTFSITLGKQTATILWLANVAHCPVAYKVKTTNLKRYCVRPNSSILQPGEAIGVELVQQAFRSAPPDLHDCRDRFLLQARALRRDSSALADAASAAHVWDSTAKTDAVLKTKFSVVLTLKAPPLAAVEDDAETRAITGGLPPIPENEIMDSVPSPPKRSFTSASPRPPLPPPRATGQENGPTSPAARSLTSASVGTPSLEPPAHGTLSGLPPAGVRASASTAAAASTAPVATSSPVQPSVSTPSPDEDTVDFQSVAFARSRALGVRPAPRIEPPVLDHAARQRIAVERAGELVRVINARQEDIDTVRRELKEARHKLSDAQMATRPAYDVRYEVNESARVPFAQICIMAIISGALLQLLV